jgi:DNA polymerase-3 subunit alpha
MYLIFDTETTGLPKNYNAPISDADNWPRLVQLAWQLHAADGALISAYNVIVKPDGFDIPYNSEKIHGISTSKALAEGRPLNEVLTEFAEILKQTSFLAGHNVGFDISIMGAEFLRVFDSEPVTTMKWLDTKDESTAFCAIPGGKGGKYKWPKLTELHVKLFNEAFDEAHNAAADVAATSRCFLELLRIGVIPHAKAGLSDEAFAHFNTLNAGPFEAEKVAIESQVAASKALKKATESNATSSDHDATHAFAHLHSHSQFSVLQSTIRVQSLVDRAYELGMPGVALTDNANMYGAFHFVNAIEGLNAKIAAENERIANGEVIGVERELFKGVVGCEFYVTDDRTDKSRQNNGYQIVLLAKDKIGYHNLAKLSSISFSEGFYYVARIDKDALLRHKTGLIATTGGLGGEVPNLILNVGEKQAEESLLWWKEQFGEDFYVELFDHGLQEEKHLNRVLLDLSTQTWCKVFSIQ